ncbi:MAG: RNA-binding protein [Thermoprotei archaeon]|nr:MAG: RNA-binding protein [Thermoprotei archaeon]
MNKSNKKIVFPGEILGVEEEYIPATGTYIDEEGYVRSQLAGKAVIDAIRKSVGVRHVHGKPLIPKPGDLVEGIVSGMTEDIAFISIYMVNDRFSRSIDFTGVIHISQASSEFIESLYDAFRIGEVVKAKVLNNNHPFQLTTKDPSLGVIVAFCSKCGAVLYKKNSRLICTRCGNSEKRKTSIFYLYR